MRNTESQRKTQSAKLSQNALKTIQKIHTQAETALKYQTFEKMNALWNEYITVLIGLRPQDEKDGLISEERFDA